jgi:uncharacterized Ntn-hydrolase superfamily protein
MQRSPQQPPADQSQDPLRGPGKTPGRNPPPVPVPPPPKPEPQPEPQPEPAAASEAKGDPRADAAHYFAFSNHSGEPAYASLLAVMGRDPNTGDLGVALLSGLPGSGGIIAEAKADTGIVLLGGQPKTLWLREAFLLLEAGRSAADTVAALTGSEQARDYAANQSMLVVLDKNGDGAHFIGSAVLGAPNLSYADAAKDCAMAGVVLNAGNRFDRIVLGSFGETAALPLPERLLVALQAAIDESRADGVINPSNKAVSAAMLVVRQGSGYDGATDRLVDVRIDFSDDPMRDLKGMYRVWCDAVLIPRLRGMLRRMNDVTSEAYKRENAWLTRMRMRYKLGEIK